MKLLIILVIGMYILTCKNNEHQPNQKMDIFKAGYPRAFFFRMSEIYAASGDYSYDEWKIIFNRLYGIQGKVLDEELPDRSVYNLEYFTRFKEEYPEQIVLLHFNGNARDPRYEPEKYFAGHWVYYQGSENVSAIPAQKGIMEIAVEDASLYRTGVGRFKDKNEDIGICMLDDSGKQNWNISEQVKLLSVDLNNNTIKVERGSYGTSALAFPAGGAWLAAHVHEGPWGGGDGHILWYYNHATNSPVDSSGKRCSDILAKEMASWFENDGVLASFDGLELDVLMSRVTSAYNLGDRKADLDGDCIPDNGVFDGVNTYSKGVLQFSKDIRKYLRKDKLYLADSFKKGHQRAFGVLNGIETEGWPALYDKELKFWDEGLNRLEFWTVNSAEPKFGYINHKWNKKNWNDQTAFARNRLVMAVSTFTNYAICWLANPRPEDGEKYGIWDELKKGVENKKGWLGQPVYPARRLAMQTPDIFQGEGKNGVKSFVSRISAISPVEVANKDYHIKISSSKQSSTLEKNLQINIQNIAVTGPDLLVSFKIKGDSLKNYPREVGRLLFAGVRDSGRDETDLGFKSWFNQDWFQVSLYFRDIQTEKVDLILEMEGVEPVWISDITAHSYPDVIIREFERGVVLGNPSLHEHEFNLKSLFPGQSFRRLTASSQQDTIVNNGKMTGKSIIVGERDAIFLIKTDDQAAE